MLKKGSSMRRAFFLSPPIQPDGMTNSGKGEGLLIRPLNRHPSGFPLEEIVIVNSY